MWSHTCTHILNCRRLKAVHLCHRRFTGQYPFQERNHTISDRKQVN